MENIDKDGRFNNELMRRQPELPNDHVSSMQYFPAQVKAGWWRIPGMDLWDMGHNGEIKFEGFAEIFENSILLELHPF